LDTYHSRLRYLSPQQWSVLNDLRGPYSVVLSSLVNRTPEYSCCASSTSGNKLSSQYAAEPPRTTEAAANNRGTSRGRTKDIFVNFNYWTRMETKRSRNLNCFKRNAEQSFYNIIVGDMPRRLRRFWDAIGQPDSDKQQTNNNLTGTHHTGDWSVIVLS